MNLQNTTPESPTTDLDAVILTALERKPSVHVPADFAARLTASLLPIPARKTLVKRPSVARNFALAGAAALTAALFAVAPHVHADRISLGLGIEMLLLVQLAGIGYGLMRLRENGL